ncbi:hypothetical protein L1987_77531 [Smallanthus sonchifolius]|uniref:Uncharacterized protein n=1 Tax=Smallanthus sonchifolius TaxID=185202 RepID=A0ACB8ZA86_9ASTR|nr:hypothetical protein L1987_77531 [Smallanthus sonchifolius]
MHTPMKSSMPFREWLLLLLFCMPYLSMLWSFRHLSMCYVSRTNYLQSQSTSLADCQFRTDSLLCEKLSVCTLYFGLNGIKCFFNHEKRGDAVLLVSC